MRSALLLIACAGACANGADTVVENRGHGCAFDWPPGWNASANLTDDTAPALPDGYDVRGFASNEPVLLWARVTASPCATDLHASCTVEQRGNVLSFDARMSWNEPTHECLIREAPPV